MFFAVEATGTRQRRAIEATPVGSTVMVEVVLRSIAQGRAGEILHFQWRRLFGWSAIGGLRDQYFGSRHIQSVRSKTHFHTSFVVEGEAIHDVCTGTVITDDFHIKVRVA